MKRNTICLFSVLTIVICLIFAFALSVSAQTGLSEDQIMIGETVNVSLDVPSGARVSAWSCTPYGALSFSATTNTGTTYKTVATAVKPGEITVRATVKYADNTTSTVTVGTLLTVLEDGIYTVGNEYADDYYSQSGAFYLRSQITYPTSGGLFVAQHSQNNFGDITNKIYNYWYIEHQGSGQYTIRSVADENKALMYVGSTFSLSNIGSTVTSAAKWYIRGENIIPVNATTKCLILSSSAPEGTYHTDGNAYTYFNLHVNGIGGIEIENWSFEKENISGVIFKKNNSEEFKTTFTKSYHIDTDTVNFSELGYSIKTYHQSGPSATTITWSSSKTSVATVNSSTGKLTIRGTGTTTITVKAKFASDSSSKTTSFILNVVLGMDGSSGNLLIYRTRNRERLGFNNMSDETDITPIIAEDLTYGQKSRYTMSSNGSNVSDTDLYVNGNKITITERKNIIISFFNSQISYDSTFMGILSEMIDHFIGGSGSDFSNVDLTAAVKNHPNTQAHVNGIVDVVKELIEEANGNVAGLYYDEALWIQPTLRSEQVVVKAFQSKIDQQGENSTFYLPVYSYNNGVPGLTLAIHGWYGCKYEIESFERQNGNYSGTLRFTFYDHFGLDTSDLADKKYGNMEAGYMSGFRQWYILQHWNELNATVQPKPFVTVVSYTVPFSGIY